MAQMICMDCSWYSASLERGRQREPDPSWVAYKAAKVWHEQHLLPSPIPEDYVCRHFQPEWWEKEQGWTRNWGDAAVSAWPRCEILRKESEDGCDFLILVEGLRQPIFIHTSDREAWGDF